MLMGDLYPHNQKVYDIAVNYFETTNKVAIIQATGTGKGVLAAEFINTIFKNKKTLVLAPNKDIIINYQKSLGVGSSKKIILMTYPSLMAKYQAFKTGESLSGKIFKDLLDTIDFLIVDEFHRLGAEKWGEAACAMIDYLDKRNKKILGLTATPVRYNDKTILNSNAYTDEEKVKLSKARNMADIIFEGNIIQGITLEEGVYYKILPSFKYVLANYGYETEIQEACETLQNLKELYGESNTAVQKLERRVEKLLKYGSEDENLQNVILKETKNLGENQKWIVFCNSEEQLTNIDNSLAIWFNKSINKFINEKEFKVNKDSLNLYSVYSNYSEQENSENLNAFYNNTEGLNVIKCINKLNEGNHVKNITGIIMLRQTLSPIVYLQQIGRALSAGNRNMPIIFDFVNNIENMTKITAGEDEFVNSILKSKSKLNKFKSGESIPIFLTEEEGSFYSKGEKVKEQPRIIIRNESLQLCQVFSEIQDILKPKSSVLWSEIEIKILKSIYPLGGAAAVLSELKRRELSNRSEDAIKAKAKEYNLIYDMKRVNKDNTLRWSDRENRLLKNYFEIGLREGKPRWQIAADLHMTCLPNRDVEAIVNQYSFITRGRRDDSEVMYARNGLPWTRDEEIALQKSYENGIPIRAICMELERSSESIFTKARKMGLYRQERKISKLEHWNDEDTQWLIENYEKLSKEELCSHLNRSWSSISRKYARLKQSQLCDMRKKANGVSKNSLVWTNVEKRLLDVNWGKPWEELCQYITTKTPKQIRREILKECKEFGIKNPYKDVKEFKELGK